MCASGLICSPRIVVSHPTSLDLSRQVVGGGAEIGRDVAQRPEPCGAQSVSGSNIRAGTSIE